MLKHKNSSFANQLLLLLNSRWLQVMFAAALILALHATGHDPLGIMQADDPEGLMLSRLQETWPSLAIGFLVGGFFSQKMEWLRRILISVVVALCIVEPVLLDQNITDIISFLLGAWTGWNILRKPGKKLLGEKKRPTTFGSAEWAMLNELHAQGHTGHIVRASATANCRRHGILALGVDDNRRTQVRQKIGND